MITGQALKNTIWTAADLVSYPLLMIGATPFFIKELGPEQYGLWMLINVVVQVMNALNFGVGDSTIREVSRYQATESQQLIQGAFNRNLSLSIILMVLCICFGMVCSMVIKHWQLFQIPETKRAEAMTALVLFAWSAGLKFIEQVFVSVFKGLQRFDIAARLTMLSRLSAIVSAIIVVYLGYGILMIVKVTLCCNAINLMIQAFMVYKKAAIKQLIPRFRLLNIRELFSSNGWYWLQSVIALLGFLSDRIIIGYLSDLKAVGYYSIAALIGSQIHNILLAFGGFVFPKVSAYTALNKSTERMYYLSRLLIAGLGWFIILFLLLFGDVIFKLWLGVDIYLEAIVYIKLYLVFAAVILLIIIPFHFINGSERVWMNSLFEFILRSMHVIAMWVGFVYYGVEGLLWGLIVTTFINIPFQYYLFHKFIVGFNRLGEVFTPVLPALAILLMAQSTHIVTKLLFLLIFGFLCWHIYYKKAHINLNLLFRKSG